MNEDEANELRKWATEWLDMEYRDSSFIYRYNKKDGKGWWCLSDADLAEAVRLRMVEQDDLKTKVYLTAAISWCYNGSLAFISTIKKTVQRNLALDELSEQAQEQGFYEWKVIKDG